MTDIYEVRDFIISYDLTFELGAFVSVRDNPFLFLFRTYEDLYVVDAEECIYLDENLQIHEIDTDETMMEIDGVVERLKAEGKNDYPLENKISLEAQIFIESLLAGDLCDEVVFDGYSINRDHYTFHYNKVVGK